MDHSSHRLSLVMDLMSGMGEAWPSLQSLSIDKLLAVDLSPGMCEKARRNQSKYSINIQVAQRDALGNELPRGQADLVICCFGLKTLSDGQRRTLTKKVFDYLKPGGQFFFCGNLQCL